MEENKKEADNELEENSAKNNEEVVAADKKEVKKAMQK